ncbi:AbrB/MazE/SpoVT family DNA-binding domain-containing protein [Salmonella enterica subsp. enterica serovar Rubislaw]|nr:AbrB/MazE/SpoVT family DNA-binding domain-containing protein [Salmonella enterica subsp. enterica serovar Oranienburg]EBG5801289.1 AbrB/MazE/SpoVT family DNA-binding domain-containing protein [Salmonella enterica subsp. enterica serovar Oranienburg]ECG6567150.1 AbrB/MazE/SpoVT family DNA-binding domain-containing protein [Salmonella enterica subsp. enterica serovar Oranienburg]EDZ7552959.1 AbrB/MazE/SpoVT family DNA-binding domain-containing protein [Salmonella enterica]EEJ7416921.1 AbrB/Maz
MKQIAIKKSGNSVTVRIPSAILKALSLSVDDPVNIDMEDGRIVITPVNQADEIAVAKPIVNKSLAEAVRVHMGLTQQGVAEYFGITLSAWAKKEQGINRLSVAEQHYFQLLTNQHPDYMMVRRYAKSNTPLQKASEAATNLAVYLSGRLVLPTETKALLSVLNGCVREFTEEWQTDLNSVVGASLPDEVTVLQAKLDEVLAENTELKKRLTKK